MFSMTRQALETMFSEMSTHVQYDEGGTGDHVL